MTFQELGLLPAILKALEAQGYRTPTPIQGGAIPPALQGRDVLGIAQTGTGKTCAFAAPILQRLADGGIPSPRVIRSLILTPTRELALQIQESFEDYGRQLPLRSAVIFGGVGQQPQVDRINRGLDILVATPGRLLDLHGQGLLDLSHVSIFVLDEADRMLDMGFIHDVRRVLKLLPRKKQTLFFSATMPPEVQGLVNELLHDPAKVTVTPVSSPVEVIDQSLYYVDKGNKGKLLAHLVSRPGVKNALVFSRTKHGANKIAAELLKAGIPAAAIHGNKSQTARQQALADFKSGKIKVLAATDIAARGLDIEELSHVFNYNLPDVPETYVHRIGRTGRAGRGGAAISFCDISEQDELKSIQRLLGKAIPVVEDHPWPMQNFDPPKRDKNGKIINPEDDEARKAARERKQKREDRRIAPGGPQQGQSPEAQSAPGLPREAAKPDRPRGGRGVTAPRQTPKEKRESAGYKASKTVDDALRAMAPQPAPRQTPKEKRDSAGGKKSERDLAFERWMAEERAIQARQGHIAAPLEGDTIMDATARLLSSKKTLPTPQPRPEQRRESRPHPQQKPAQSRQKPVPPPQKSPQKPVQPPQKSPQKPAQSPQPQKSHPQPAAKSGGSLEARRAKIRQAAKARGPVQPTLRPSSQKDSTEYESLMKPYYLNGDD